MRWPGQLEAGTVIDEPVSTIDILPTLAGLAGVPVPDDRTIDGVDMWPVLTGNFDGPLHTALFGFVERGFDEVHLGSIRSGKWKLHVATKRGSLTPVALYDLDSDIGETIDHKAEEPATVASLLSQGSAIVADITANQRPLGRVIVGDKAFAQKVGAGGGLIAVEAEHFFLNQTRGGQYWGIVDPSHSSAGESVQALPNSGTNINVNYTANSPHLKYRVAIDFPGRYYFWVRAKGEANTDDSIHVGLNGRALASGYRLSEIESHWTWSSTLMDGARSFIDITKAGEYDIDIWMREDGVVLDKFVLTSEPSFAPTGKGPVESGQGALGPLLEFSPPSLNFSTQEGAAAPASQSVSLVTTDTAWVAYTIASSEPDWLSISSDSGVTPENDLAVIVDSTGLSSGLYTGTLTVSADGYLSDTIDVTLTVVGESAGFQQEPSSGLVSIEVEDYDTNTPKGGHTWNSLAASGASGPGALQASPNIQTNNNTGFVNNSPQLDFLINFTTSGTHYVWIRGKGATNSDDSAHVGLGGAAQPSADRITGFAKSWAWSNATMDGVRATINVPQPGEQTLNLWMREDGLVIDKIMLTTDPSTKPTDFGTLGPASSPRGAE